uniref:ELK domain-containing protein n=1 Tax=Periophthalmus magnuspinnatus TaxID=409849 RepID=A0A3B3ZBW4_9GOBI
RQKRAKGGGSRASKKAQKGKSQDVPPQNDCATQDPHVDSAPPSTNGQERNGKGKTELLQQAVEKRNEIIAKLSANLQEALSSRDKVQMEAQTLTGQIQALQKQLQQVCTKNVSRLLLPKFLEFSRIKSLHGHSSDSDSSSKDAPPECKNQGSNTNSDEETTNVVVKKLKLELENEKERSQNFFDELQKERNVVLLLEEEKREWEEELKRHLIQLQDLQSQCLEMQQYKRDKERLNMEVLELKQMLQEKGDAEKRHGEEAASSVQLVRSLEEELEIVKKQLEDREKELKFREEEVQGLKVSKNRQNQARAGFTCNEANQGGNGDGSEEVRSSEDSLNVSLTGDVLMERYLSSEPPACSQSSLVFKNLTSFPLLSFELNSEILGDHALLSISNRLEVHEGEQSMFPWLNSSQNDKLDLSNTSAHSEDAHLEKDLLYQQCRELHEELTQKDRDLEVLREEVTRSAEELEEARSRWAQVTEELREALLELEEEKEKRTQMEEAMLQNNTEQEELQNKSSALQEEKRAEVREEECAPSEPVDLLVFSPQQRKGKVNSDLSNDLKSELEDAKRKLKTSTELVNQRTLDSQAQLLNLQTQMDQLLLELDHSKASLDQTEKEKSDLESQLVCLSQNVSNLEETHGKALEEKEEYRRRAEEMNERINKMEQVLEEELEQFENLLKSKDSEVRLFEFNFEHRQISEKELKELMEKQDQAVEEATEMVRKSYQQEISELQQKHQQETSELKVQFDNRLLELQFTLEGEQKRQINLIKQVTEREHERMMAELTSRHTEEMDHLRTEVTLELRESMEAAHQAEMDQAQKMLELEALRLSLTNVHQSHLELSQDAAVGKIQASMKETFTQERALIQARHHMEMDQVRRHHEEEQERRQQLHQSQMGKLNQTQTELDQINKDLTEAQAALSQARLEIQQSQAKLDDYHTSSQQQELKSSEELKQALSERDAATRLLEELVSSHKDALQDKEQEVLLLQGKESELQQQVKQLQKEKSLLKQNSQEEVGQLWTQLESMRTNRQELGELKEQLRARSAQVEDIERLKVDFNEQKREIKQQNETELESLRRYFEQRLQVAEEGYREEIALLQLRMVEGALEESVLKTLSLKETHNPKLSLKIECFIYKEMLHQLEEKHTMELDELRSSLSKSFKEELRQVRSDLTDQYYKELMEMKTRHALEMEQLKAKLSESHLRGAKNASELTHLEDSLQKEKEEMQKRLTTLKEELQQKHEFELCALREEFGKERDHLEKALKEENNKLTSLQAALDSDNRAFPHSNIPQCVCQCSQPIFYLFIFVSRFQDEKATLEHHLSQKYESSLSDIKEKHKSELAQEKARALTKHSQEMDALTARYTGQLDTLSTSHRDQLAAMATQLQNKHNTELVALEAALHSQRKLDLASLEAAFQETSQAQLQAQEAQLERKHQEDKDELERRMLGNMDTLEATYLREVQVRAQILVELSSQKEALDTEHCQALEALKRQVLELEQQHSAALQELTSTYAAEIKQLTEQHQVQLQELKNISARELEACRRELEESSSRQRQHFTEEVELLKVQSEDRLQDRLQQIKTEFEVLKEAELEKLRRSHTTEQEEKERSYTSKMSQLTAQLQQLDAVVAQLREEVGCLQGELEGKRSEMETLDTLLQRRERESQEGGNLLKMLTDDLTTLVTANEKLRKVVVEMVRSTIATEELIGQKIRSHNTTSTEAKCRRSSTGNKDAHEAVADLSSEDLELTHTLCESLLVSDKNLTPEGEEAALSASGRLHHTVGILLDLLNQANTQVLLLSECSNLQKFIRGRDDSAQLVEQHRLLMEQLNEEAKQKSHLQLELHKVEGLLQGFVAEKAILEETLQQKETQEERMAEELEGLKELSEEHAILLRQKEHLSADLGEREKALLTEVEHLAADRLDLQRQAEKDHSSLSQRIRALERELEDQETKGLETEQHHKTHTEDLHQRVQALEKQLKHNRQFIEEQAVEREHERDEFQQEIKKLENQLRQTTGTDNKGLKVENLQAIIKDKTEDHAILLATNQQFQRELAERNEEIDKLAGRIRELEQALLSSAETSRTVNQLEQELHRAMLREQELTQDKQALEQQQLSNRLQISALQSKLDETRHCYLKNSHEPTQELREALDTAQQNLDSKEQEVEVLLGQLETVQRDLGIKEVELKHLTLQLELIATQNTAHVNELQDEIALLKRREEPEDKEAEEDTFASALLLEKNLEIDQLHNEIHRLEQELEHSAENKDVEMEQLRSQVEDLRSQVEHLQSETLRIRHDKEEEEERLHEVISTLQAELATLGPNLHEVSDSQDGDSINPSPAPSPEPQLYTIQEPKTRPNNLKQELGVSYPASTRSLRSRLKALQSQLETVAAEKEGLERLLHTQEQEYRGHGEEFAKRLKSQMERFEELQSVLNGKNCELEQLRSQFEEQGQKMKAIQDEMDSCKTQDQNLNVLHEEIAQLHSLVAELQSKDKERLEEIDTLKAKDEGMKSELGVLRESRITLERKIQASQDELVHMETLVTEKRSKVELLETVTEELTAQRAGKQEIERLKQELVAMRGRVQELTEELRHKERNQQEEQKEVLSHAEQTLAKADAVLKEKELKHHALSKELSNVKRNLEESTEKAEKLQREAQHKEQVFANLESHNQQLKAELQNLKEDLAAQEEELNLHRRELQTLRLRYRHDVPPHQPAHKGRNDVILSSHGDVSLSSPEVLRRLECSSDRFPERLHTSVLESRLSELSALNTSALDLPQTKPSPRVQMEPAHSRTITPEPVSRSSHSPVSGSNYSTMDSLDTDKVQELEELDITTPSTPLGSTSSMSAPEWASDGYGSNVSSDLGARLRAELEQTERLDAQFVEYLRCRGINPTANTDSAAGSMSFSEELLSPELQALLRKVYQESCRILTLSQRRGLCRPPGSEVKSLPPMSWQQEKRALQETVIALRELLCRMAQKHNAEGGGPLPDGHMELQLRAELEERQKEVQRAHNIQQEQKNKIQTLRSDVMALRGQVDQERVACSNLRRELQIEQSRSMLLEKHLGDLQQELEKAQQQSTHLQDVSSQKNQLEHLLNQAQSRLAESHCKLDEERSRFSKQVEELNQRHELDAARDGKFISNLREQLEQERKRSEELASTIDRLRADLLQSRRKWEEEERVIREEMQREQEALARQKAALESLKEQKQDACRELEAEKSLSKRQGAEITELKEKMGEEKRRSGRGRGGGAGRSRPRGTRDNKTPTCELELLRQQDQQRLKELQRTLAELEREEREMARQRLSGQHHKVQTDSPKLPAHAQYNQQFCLSVVFFLQLQRLYERYLRAESFRKALVYQKRYLLLLIGGFQQCEQATLCLIATMGVRPSPYPSLPQRGMEILTIPIKEFCQHCFRSHSSSTLASVQTGTTSQDPERSLTEYIQHLEKVQHRLAGVRQSG